MRGKGHSAEEWGEVLCEAPVPLGSAGDNVRCQC